MSGGNTYQVEEKGGSSSIGYGGGILVAIREFAVALVCKDGDA